MPWDIFADRDPEVSDETIPATTVAPPTLEACAVELAKGVVGLPHEFILHNQTNYTVKLLVSEDPEALVTTHSGVLRLAGQIESPLGVGLGATAQGQRSGARAPADYTVPPFADGDAAKKIWAASSTVFIMAAFVRDGSFKLIFQNRPLEAGAAMSFLDRHLLDETESWIRAPSLQQAAALRNSIHPNSPAGHGAQQSPAGSTPQSVQSDDVQQRIARDASGGATLVDPPPRRCQRASFCVPNIFSAPPGKTAQGMTDVRKVLVWSSTNKAYMRGEVCGVALPGDVDPLTGVAWTPGSLYVKYEGSGGEHFYKAVPVAQIGDLLRPVEQTGDLLRPAEPREQAGGVPGMT